MSLDASTRTRDGGKAREASPLRLLGLAVLLAVAVLFPFIPLGVQTDLIRSIVVFALSTAALALSWDILARTGQLSLAHAAFFGLGAYTFALVAPRLQAAIPGSTLVAHVLALLAGGLVAAVVSVVLGLVTLRLSGMYFAIATLAFAEVVRTIVNQLPVEFAGGPQGILVPALLGGNNRDVYWAGLAILLLTIGVSLWVERSRLGYAFTAIRQGELVARVLGVKSTKFKLFAFIISSFLAGLVGGFVAGKTFYLTPPDAFNLSVSVSALVVPIFGGLYTTAGPVLAAFILRFIEEGLRLLVGQGYLVGYGVILVLSILFLPRGIVGLYRQLTRRTSANSKEVKRG
jgi:branched-chain amino acid transport system permease protein